MSVFLLAAIARDRSTERGCHVACALIGTNATASRSRRFNGYQECGCPSYDDEMLQICIFFINEGVISCCGAMMVRDPLITLALNLVKRPADIHVTSSNKRECKLVGNCNSLVTQATLFGSSGAAEILQNHNHTCHEETHDSPVWERVEGIFSGDTRGLSLALLH